MLSIGSLPKGFAGQEYVGDALEYSRGPFTHWI